MKLTMSFRGTQEALKDILEHEGIVGGWSMEPNGVHRLKLTNGTGLHWSTTTGALWCDGPAKAVERLESRVVMALHWLSFRDGQLPPGAAGNDL